MGAHISLDTCACYRIEIKVGDSLTESVRQVCCQNTIIVHQWYDSTWTGTDHMVYI